MILTILAPLKRGITQVANDTKALTEISCDVESPTAYMRDPSQTYHRYNLLNKL